MTPESDFSSHRGGTPKELAVTVGSETRPRPVDVDVYVVAQTTTLFQQLEACATLRRGDVCGGCECDGMESSIFDDGEVMDVRGRGESTEFRRRPGRPILASPICLCAPLVVRAQNLRTKFFNPPVLTSFQ